MFVFGGITNTRISGSSGDGDLQQEVVYDEEMDADSPGLSELWQFKAEHKMWKRVNQNGLIPFLSSRSDWRMVLLGRKVVIVSTGSRQYDTIDRANRCEMNISKSAFVFDLTTSTWSTLADPPPLLPIALTFWEGKIVLMAWSKTYNLDSFDKFYHVRYSIVFSFLNPSCPAGYYSMKWETESCKRCPVGSYAAHGASDCSFCSEGLTTNSSMPKSLSDCVCQSDFCEKENVL